MKTNKRHRKACHIFQGNFWGNFPYPLLPLILQESATDPASAGKILRCMSVIDLTDTSRFDAWKWKLFVFPFSTGAQPVYRFTLQTFQRLAGQKRKSLEEEDGSGDLSNQSVERMEERNATQSHVCSVWMLCICVGVAGVQQRMVRKTILFHDFFLDSWGPLRSFRNSCYGRGWERSCCGAGLGSPGCRGSCVRMSSPGRRGTRDTSRGFMTSCDTQW